jgi:glycosidase
VVPHHIHREHPYWQTHAGDGWFMHPDGSCVCGAPGCDWTDHIGDCWFASYLPSFDWTNADVADAVTADVAWWLDRFDGDGLRIDAVPMMPRAATRRIAAAARARFDQPGHASFLLGENFTGPAGYGLLRYQLGPFGLDSEFNFPLMWALRAAVATATAPLSDVDAAVQAGIAEWTGSGAVMAAMLGNHDVTRFASVSAGDADGDGWTPAPQPTDPLVYTKQELALALVYTLPGAPVVYYGDEVALAGRADPDSRRVMPSEGDLGALQKQTRAYARALGAARACSLALRRGSYRTLYADAETLAFAREADGGDVAVVIAARQPNGALAAPLPGIAAGSYVDVLSGRVASLDPALTNLSLTPFSVALLVPTGSSCAGLAPPSP